MTGEQLVFDPRRPLVFVEQYPKAGEFTYLADMYDLNRIKNELWKGVRGVQAEYPDAFGDLDLSILSVWLTPASGDNCKGAGFMYYQNIGGHEQAHMAFSLAMLDRLYTVQADREAFMREFIMHELCHLVLYTEVGDHEERGEDFHSLLKAVGAPTNVRWTDAEHQYEYVC